MNTFVQVCYTSAYGVASIVKQFEKNVWFLSLTGALQGKASDHDNHQYSYSELEGKSIVSHKI